MENFGVRFAGAVEERGPLCVGIDKPRSRLRNAMNASISSANAPGAWLGGRVERRVRFIAHP